MICERSSSRKPKISTTLGHHPLNVTDVRFEPVEPRFEPEPNPSERLLAVRLGWVRMGSVWGLQEAPYLERVRTWVHAFEPVTFTPRIVGPLLCLHKKIDYVLIRGGISSRPGGDTDPQFSVPPVTAMADNEGCALNPDGTLKESNQIQWVHSPSQETVQLPGTQLSGCCRT